MIYVFLVSLARSWRIGRQKTRRAGEVAGGIRGKNLKEIDLKGTLYEHVDFAQKSG